jgi:hypothetical protein
MTQHETPQPAPKKTPFWRRRWVSVGEAIGVIGLAVAVLSYCDAHRERKVQVEERTAEQRQAQARSVLVLTAQATEDGGRLNLSPMKSGQAVQSQRYIFPRPVLDHAMQVDAAQPQIQRGWFEDGLKHEIEEAAKASGGRSAGEGELPVGVITTYIEDGETRTDRTIYQVGYRIEKGGLLRGSKVILLGVSLARRLPKGDLQAAVDASWTRARSQGLAATG